MSDYIIPSDPETECPDCAGEGTTGERSWRMDPETGCYDDIKCSTCHGRGVLGGSRYDQLAAKHPELFHEEIVHMVAVPARVIEWPRDIENCPF